MFRSATFRLTVWYLAIVTAISLVFSIVVYHFAANELMVGLHHQTQRIFDDFPVFNGNPLLRPGQDAAAGEHNILLRLIYFNVLVVVVAGFASYFFARRTLQPIEAAHEQQKRFTADVSHELRTPLTSLKMGAEVALMDKKADSKELREALESSLEDANKMDMLISNLLRLTKLDADEAEIGFAQLDIKPLVEDAIMQVKRVADIKHVQITHAVASKKIVGDRDSLQQLLVILLDNAIKYSPENSTIHVAAAIKDNTLQISVRDEGQGIEPDALPHVFDRFYRADKSRNKTTVSGYGLGLSIGKLIADRHNGTITLASTKGKGTTATLTLPIADQKSV